MDFVRFRFRWFFSGFFVLATLCQPLLFHAQTSGPSGGLVLDGVNWGNLNSQATMPFIKNNITPFFDLNLLRSDPSLLDDPQILRYFVAINNCDNVGGQRGNLVIKAMHNELDYPAIAQFYKGKATEFLADIPRTTRITIGAAALGDFDTTKNVFPILMFHPGSTPKQIELPRQAPVVATSDIPRGSPACGEAGNLRTLSANAGGLAAIYVFDIDQAHKFSEVPMTVEAARKYIENAPPNRQVRFDAELTLLDSPAPKIIKNCANKINQTCVEFPAKLNKVSVVKPLSSQMFTYTPDEIIATIYP